MVLSLPHNWGVFKDVYCAGNDSTMAFLKAVLDETCEMFPSEVIHIGGDEVPKVRWAECPKCQAKMAELGLQTEAELQTHFINEIGTHLARKGRRIMGWDEILEGGLPEGAMVQSWRGMEGAVEATHLGTDAVVSPTSHCYLDYPLRSTDLEEAYSFVPVPGEAMGHEGQIVGGECNMWSEHAPQDRVMSKAFPRATGLAEVFWSGPAVTQQPGAYDAFLVRLDALSQRWGFLGVTPGLEGVPVAVDVQPDTQGQVAVTVRPAIRNAGGMVTFTPDGTSPGDEILRGRVGETLRVSGVGSFDVDVTMRGRKTGVVERFPVAGHLGAHRPLVLSHKPSVHYTGGGPQALAVGAVWISGTVPGKQHKAKTWRRRWIWVLPRLWKRCRCNATCTRTRGFSCPTKCAGRCPRMASTSTCWGGPNPRTPWRPTAAKRWCPLSSTPQGWRLGLSG